MGIDGTYLNIIKTIYDKVKDNIILNGEKLKAFLLMSGTRQGLFTLTTFIQHSLRSPRYGSQKRKEKKKKRKGTQIRKEEEKLSLLQMTYNTENPKDATRKLLELISESDKVAGHKINKQKSLAFLYVNNERPERQTEETIQFTITSKR